MRTRLRTVYNKLASLPGWTWRFWQRNKTFRYVVLSLAANAMGYSLVFILTSRGVGKWWANESVSKSMAPVGLLLNTLALTGKLRPSVRQATKWTAYWLPSALASAVCMGFVIAKFGLGSLESRAVAGMMMFPFDYTIKRLIIFTKQAWLARFLFKQKISLIVVGVLVWKRLSLTTSHLMPPKIELA